jgi:hypothetical protein
MPFLHPFKTLSALRSLSQVPQIITYFYNFFSTLYHYFSIYSNSKFFFKQIAHLIHKADRSNKTGLTQIFVTLFKIFVIYVSHISCQIKIDTCSLKETSFPFFLKC